MGATDEGSSQAISRELTAGDFGIRGVLTKLDATLSVDNSVATVRVRIIEGRISNPLSIVSNLGKVAKAAGASELRIEGTPANERLANVLTQRYGMTSFGAMDTIVIQLYCGRRNMNVQSRAKRILTPLSSYQPIEEVGSSLFPLRDFAVLRGATPLGVYSNTPGESHEALLVSDVGVFLNCGEEVRVVEYKTIDKVDVAAEGKIVGADTTALKSEADGLLVTAGCSAPLFLPVRNGHGKFRDAFEFSRFMSRAAEDSKSEVIGLPRPASLTDATIRSAQ